MIPDLSFTCGGACCTVSKITVQQAKRYAEIMRKNGKQEIRAAMFYNLKILQLFFGGSVEEIEQEDVRDVLTAAKAIHFVMQEIVLQKFAELAPEAPPQGASAFDDIDREEDEEAGVDPPDPWEITIENIDAVVKMAIVVMHDSYTGVMNAELVELLDHIAYEIKTANQK